MAEQTYRIESDSLGEVAVPGSALYGAQTQRALDNFHIGGMPMPGAFIRALGLIKAAAARANAELGLLDPQMARSIRRRRTVHFPIDIFQTGSGTSSNMNANEVISTRATALLGDKVHPNDHVNMSQSSNDVIPTAIHVGAALIAREDLLPALAHLAATLARKAEQHKDVVKTGRTHLMDAMPIRLDQEIGAWKAQIDARPPASKTPSPASPSSPSAAPPSAPASTPTPTSAPPSPTSSPSAPANPSSPPPTNSSTWPPKTPPSNSAASSKPSPSPHQDRQRPPLDELRPHRRPRRDQPRRPATRLLHHARQDQPGHPRGRLHGRRPDHRQRRRDHHRRASRQLPAQRHAADDRLQPHAKLTIAATVASRQLADQAIADFTVNEATTRDLLGKNPILVTALNRAIGYDLGAKIAKTAYKEKRPLKDVAREMTDLDDAQLDALLDPRQLTEGGIHE
jgi:fumarate hydratase class II